MDGKQRYYALTGCSGAGKGTVCGYLTSMLPDLYLAVSLTTRGRGAGEVDGVHYRYVSRRELADLKAAGRILTGDEYLGNLYADEHPPDDVELALFEVTIKAALAIKEKCPDTVVVWLDPVGTNRTEQLGWLEYRLRERGRDTEAQIRDRLAKAERELDWVDALDPGLVVRRCNVDSLETARWLSEMMVGDGILA